MPIDMSKGARQGDKKDDNRKMCDVFLGIAIGKTI